MHIMPRTHQFPVGFPNHAGGGTVGRASALRVLGRATRRAADAFLVAADEHAASWRRVGFIAPENYISTMTFQVWAMLIIGGSGNNRGALLGAVLVWGLWSVTGALLAAFVPGEYQARAAALQIVLIGAALAALLVLRPRGILGEEKMISRFLKD